MAGIDDILDPEAFAAAFTAPSSATSPVPTARWRYACAQIIIQSLDAAVDGGTADPAGHPRGRPCRRLHAAHAFDTVLGPLSHSMPTGDTSQKFISFYKTDPALDDGAGGWVYMKQQDFGGQAPSVDGVQTSDHEAGEATSRPRLPYRAAHAGAATQAR